MTKDELKLALKHAIRDERHLSNAETRYWCDQYKLLATQAIEALAQPEEKYQYGTPLLDAFTKDEALKKIATVNAMDYEYQAWAREALAQGALDRKAENAKELGLDYEPDKNEFKPDWDEKLALTEEVIRLSKRIEELEAQPSVSVEQEPVMWKDMAFARLGVVRDKMHLADVETVQRFLDGDYTTPPQRPSRSDIKPLTDEDIDELSRSMVKGDKSLNWLCRAIERKHGIKGEA